MSSIFKAFKAASPTASANFSSLAASGFRRTQTKILRFGALGTIGAALGAGVGADMANDYPRQRKEDIQKGAIAGAALGAALTGAVLARRPIGTFLKAAGAGAKEGGKVFFRRIRGRIVPIRVK